MVRRMEGGKMNTTKNLKESLCIIEGLAMYFQDTDMKLRTAKKIIDDIYFVSHLHSGCKGFHISWRERRYKILKILRDMGYIGGENGENSGRLGCFSRRKTKGD